jgi:hypothetical protein
MLFSYVELQEENKYKQFMIKECRKILGNNRMVAVLQPIPLKGQQVQALKNRLFKIGMNLAYDYPVAVLK